MEEEASLVLTDDFLNILVGINICGISTTCVHGYVPALTASEIILMKELADRYTAKYSVFI